MLRDLRLMNDYGVKQNGSETHFFFFFFSIKQSRPIILEFRVERCTVMISVMFTGPKAKHDDNTLGLLLAHRNGCQRLLEKSQDSLEHFANEILCL